LGRVGLPVIIPLRASPWASSGRAVGATDLVSPVIDATS